MRHTKNGSAYRQVAAVVAAALLATLASCSDANLASGPVINHQLESMSLKAYKVGIGDKLKLEVFGEKDLSGTYDVDNNGAISLPLIGPLNVVGENTATIRQNVSRRLANGYLNTPKVTVDVDTYRPIYVHGEVKTGGAFPFKVGTRLRDAVAVAGGYTYRADSSYIVLSRDGMSKDTRINMPSDLFVMPGDNIRVPERYF
ncbi:MAG: polysaccharide biosynthesis/export family protein [Hyphomicrobiaceae bacterium]